MNTRNKWLLRAQSLFLVLTILSSLLVFDVDKAFAEERPVAPSSAQTLKSIPVAVPVPEQKVQVLYEVKYINEADGTNVSYPVKKLAFSGDVVTEKASNIKGYELISDAEQTLTLKAEGNEPIVFRYRAVDSEALIALKTLTKEKIDNLKKAPLYEKNAYKADVDKALTEKEVNDLFEEIKKIDETTKVQVKYQVKYVDKDTRKEISRTVTKIAFADEVITEKATSVKGYVALENTKTATLVVGENEIVFEYEKEQVAPKKVQVKYQIKYVDQDGKEISRTITKIDFSGNTVTEKASNLKGYELVSEASKTLVLKAEGNEPIVFRYRAVDSEALNTLKTLTKEKIDNLKKAPLYEKNAYKAAVDKALTEKEVNDLFEEIKKIDEATKVQVRYQIKYVDQDGKEIGRTITKIDFVGNTVTEKADVFKGYELTSEPVKTIVLQPKNNDPVVFEYRAVADDALNKLKEDTKRNIDKLEKVSFDVKEAYKQKVDQATDEKQVNDLFEEIKKLNESAKPQVEYRVRYVNKDGEEIAPTATKSGHEGQEITEEAIDIDKYIKPEETTKSLILVAVENEIIFEYEKTDEIKTLKEFIREKADPNKELTYSDINFAGRPEELKEYIIKSVYRRKLAIVFYATEKDVDQAYWELWNKTTEAGLLRLARYWTGRDSVRGEETDTPGVYKYAIGITYHISPEQMIQSEDKVDEIIAKYDLTNKTDFQKAKIIHDYLTKYPTPNTGRNEWGYNVYNHSSVLLGNVGLCEGYAIAYNRIAERAGLESKFVGGILIPYYNPKTKKAYIEKVISQMQTEVFDKRLNHAWNQVKIDGKWYHLDSYHAAYFYRSDIPEERTQVYSVFLKSEKFLWKDLENRIWNNKFTEESLENYKGSFKLEKDI
ncbi:MucBP domain-containing protein [Filifactor villosus]|uniref:MucBP domain-containing protein n=1 Tax=Filifactor villosus TaxID=29374 RepID=A0ABV9QI23_9FIRM